MDYIHLFSMAIFPSYQGKQRKRQYPHSRVTVKLLLYRSVVFEVIAKTESLEVDAWRINVLR
jgi:hypothetical protein